MSTKHELDWNTIQKICENLWDLWLIPVLIALVAQLDRALASGAKGCGFDPRRAQCLSNQMYVHGIIESFQKISGISSGPTAAIPR